MSRAKDFTGMTFGRWTVIRRVENSNSGFAQWLCRCACGTERVVRGANLVNGKSVSCHCLNEEVSSVVKTSDLTPGKRFGSWKIIAFDAIRGQRSYWLCKCICGTERSVSLANLGSGRSQSCGQCGRSKSGRKR